MSAIKVGDLVQVVRACCPQQRSLGAIGVVAWIGNATTTCSLCGGTVHIGRHAGAALNATGVPLSWLRKIDPDQASDREREFDQLSRRDKVLA